MLDAISLFFWGTVLALVIQYVCTLLTFPLQIPDPAIEWLYSSIGIATAIVLAGVFAFKKKWALALGTFLGPLLWWPYLSLWMGLTGNYL